ncbi:MAG: extracellular solute-binding protein [Candidatus Eiseniibacteriota bacterium]|jgi:microcin C transport system substrate-binding protein
MNTVSTIRLALPLAAALLAGAVAGDVASAEDLSALPWETNYDDPPIGDPEAQKGGTFKQFITSYPLTFRLMGPNSNDAFAGWNRSFTFDFTLVRQHPVTDRWIPWMATEWAVLDDNRTVYYRLDPDARWSDGRPVVADDYVFTYEMMGDESIVDPFYNQYVLDHFESVEALDDLTLKVVGKYESWRPLADFGLFPMPRHATHLGPDWVQEANNVYPTVVGPYVVSETDPGQYVVFERIRDWWGEEKHYFKGMWNPDRIYLKVIADSDRAFDFFVKREIDYYRVQTAKKWATEMDFEAGRKGWSHRKREFVDYPQGLYGLAMNLEKPIFQNKDFRKAIQYMFNFRELNEKLMYNAYYPMASAFTGTPYANPDLKPYGFDPRKAREHLQAAGYTRRGKDGILVDDQGHRASFTLTYGQKGLERHFTVLKQTFQRLGVEVNLRLLEPGTAFERGLERQYEMTVMSRTSGFWPSPFQYFGSHFKQSTNNNNIWWFGTAYTDSLIDVYRFDLDRDKRLAAMHELDAIIQDEAFYVPFWQAPFMRFLYWDHVRFPETFFPKRIQQLTDWHVYWIDSERQARLETAIQKGTDLGEDPVIDVDPWGVKDRLEAMMSGS